MRRGGYFGRENSICKIMVVVDNVRCLGNINVVMLEYEVGQKVDKEGEMIGDEVGQVGIGLISIFCILCKDMEILFCR